jgi:hypothetical protein
VESTTARNDTPDHPDESTAAKVVRIESGEDGVFDQLEDIAAHPAKTWTARALPKDAKPEEWIVSDHVAGVVEYLEGRQSEYGPYMMAELRLKSDERVAVHLFGSVLSKWGSTLRTGDGLAVTYLGKRPSTQGQDYDAYEVVAVRDGRRISPSQILGELDEPEEPGDLPMAGDA